MSQSFIDSDAAKALTPEQVAAMSDDEAREVFKRIRWAGGSPVCPKCGGSRIYQTVGYSKTIKCANFECQHQFSHTSGTIFASRKMPLRKYLMAIALLNRGGRSYSARQFTADLGVGYHTGYTLAQQLRGPFVGRTTIERARTGNKEHETLNRLWSSLTNACASGNQGLETENGQSSKPQQKECSKRRQGSDKSSSAEHFVQRDRGTTGWNGRSAKGDGCGESSSPNCEHGEGGVGIREPACPDQGNGWRCRDRHAGPRFAGLKCCLCGGECDGSLMRHASRRTCQMLFDPAVPRHISGAIKLCQDWFAKGFIPLLADRLERWAEDGVRQQWKRFREGTGPKPIG